MQINESLIRSVVAQVLAEVGRGGNNGAPVGPKSFTGRYGIFTCPDEAVAAAYGWPADLSDDEVLRRLFELNQERAAVQAVPAAAAEKRPISTFDRNVC